MAGGGFPQASTRVIGSGSMFVWNFSTENIAGRERFVIVDRPMVIIGRRWPEAACVGGHVSERVFSTGLCLPSGSSLTDDQQG